MADPTLHLSLPVDDLKMARTFYERTLGCRIGRTRDHWFDVWFFGLQLTLQLCPDEVTGPRDPGIRHFGVVFDDETSFRALVQRIDEHDAAWIERPALHDDAGLSRKIGGKLADPAGNVIEIKYYADAAPWKGQRR